MSALKSTNGKQAAIHVVQKGSRFNVYDAQSRYRAGFDTKEQADAYAAQLTGGVAHRQDNNRPFQSTEN